MVVSPRLRPLAWTVLLLFASSVDSRRDCHTICTLVRAKLNPLKPCKNSRRAGKSLGRACKSGFDHGFQHVCIPLCEHGDTSQLNRDAANVCAEFAPANDWDDERPKRSCEAGYTGVMNQVYKELKQRIVGEEPQSLDELVGAHHPHVVEVFENASAAELEQKQRQSREEVHEVPTPTATSQPTTPIPFEDGDDVEPQVSANDVFGTDDSFLEDERNEEMAVTAEAVFGREPHMVRMRVTVPTSPMEPGGGVKHVHVDLVANGTLPTLQDAVHQYCRDAELGESCHRIVLMATHEHLLLQEAAGDLPVGIQTWHGPSASQGEFDLLG